MTAKKKTVKSESKPTANKKATAKTKPAPAKKAKAKAKTKPAPAKKAKAPARKPATATTAKAKPAANPVAKKAPAKSKAAASTARPATKTPAKKASTKAKTTARKAKPAKKASASKTNKLSAEREQVMRKSVRRKNDSSKSSAIAQERASKALESISVVRHDKASEGKGSSSRKKCYNQRELVSFRDMLLRVREQLVLQVQSLRSASLTREDAVNSEEDGTDAFERQLALKLASDEGDSIFEIDEALQRINEGTYGVCQECVCLIGKERLKALPFTNLCIACRSASEKNNHHHARHLMV